MRINSSLDIFLPQGIVMKNRYVLCLCLMLGTFLSATAQEDLMQKLKEYRQQNMSGSASAAPSLNIPRHLSRNSSASGFSTDMIANRSVLLDKKIDPEEYILGPGDELSVYLWGITEKEYHLPVTSEGKVVIPLVGELQVAGSSLADARKAISDTLLKVHRRVQISTTLSELRVFRTFVTGEIPNPGACVIDGATRVSDVLETVNIEEEAIKRRNIHLTSADGQVRLADLARFYNSNSIEHNPYIREGERVFIPPTTRVLSIAGRVQNAGEYDYVQDDDLHALIEASGGLMRDADSSRIVLTRFTNDVDQLERIDLSLPEDLSFELRPDDRVLVKALEEYRVHRNVTIEGEVRYAGVYPIRKDKTRLNEVIEMAGGLTDDAYLDGSFVVRNWDMRVAGQKPSPDRLVNIINATNAGASEIPQSELSYLKAEFLESPGKITVDFREALNDSENPNNLVLREGDRIVVARTSLTVRVMGAVVAPGLVAHAPDQKVSKYVSLAGGLNHRARRSGILVKKVGTDVWLKPGKVESIDPGDLILVPERRYRDPFNATRDIIGVVGSVATVILGFIAISDRLR